MILQTLSLTPIFSDYFAYVYTRNFTLPLTKLFSVSLHTYPPTRAFLPYTVW